ncbi:Sideroflexin-5 [Taphrina deformans PYCC 5710]|uniref:Sidoreflexin n=1 Tax=Taphrina deformans (strain PYCC 5710 / ATCC 11124 / CBS 356.35 / IMI 108563 / JCM 9778 / NBRC 8474) TaxID=1097556 RepID=R4X721_TAPDE|nr:Sideroflexin-5 [Taphrina deformans PYCC 5710]|eukprot:CCG80843.1 Sideroflexin-5 [Taphrina deformans PYCC 5710]
MAREVPQSRYDLSTYRGRVLHTIQITDPQTLLTTSAQLQDARRLIDAYRNRQTELSEDVWSAKKILDSSVHPETGELILLPFRMSCFVLTNLVVTAGMLTPNLKTKGTLFWQVTNQSVNVAFNYANANKSSPLSTREIGISYVTAVVASCGVAVGLGKAVQFIKAQGTRELAGRLVPFVAVAGAGALNVFLMRSGELRSGIDVFDPRDERDESLGKSKSAAWKAISETAASRVLNSSPIMVIPPLILLAIQRKTTLLHRSPRLGLPINLLSIFATSIVALPLAIAAFPTREYLPVQKLEPKIKKEAEEKGLQQVVFNRGM